MATTVVCHNVALSVCLGHWKAEGTSYGGPINQVPIQKPTACAGQVHVGCWHTGEFFYDVTVDGNIWRISGETERATIEFSSDNRTQTIVWEWKPKGK